MGKIEEERNTKKIKKWENNGSETKSSVCSKSDTFPMNRSLPRNHGVFVFRKKIIRAKTVFSVLITLTRAFFCFNFFGYFNGKIWHVIIVLCDFLPSSLFRGNWQSTDLRD